MTSCWETVEKWMFSFCATSRMVSCGSASAMPFGSTGFMSFVTLGLFIVETYLLTGILRTSVCTVLSLIVPSSKVVLMCLAVLDKERLSS